ncbi:hypothetical protein BDR04DRAFT_1089671 [Suillus decipiens]|nr:hypothetical protein BDR04DRAFT_1089671 [Suillus decipiens]
MILSDPCRLFKSSTSAVKIQKTLSHCTSTFHVTAAENSYSFQKAGQFHSTPWSRSTLLP